jgi:hypothetical protein
MIYIYKNIARIARSRLQYSFSTLKFDVFLHKRSHTMGSFQKEHGMPNFLKN